MNKKKYVSFLSKYKKKDPLV